MAKKDTMEVQVVPSGPPKMKPRASVSWDQKDLKPDGLDNVALGKTVTVELTGTVTGHSMDEYGCSLSLEPTAMTVEPEQSDDDEGPSMVAVVRRMGKKVKAGEGY